MYYKNRYLYTISFVILSMLSAAGFNEKKKDTIMEKGRSVTISFTGDLMHQPALYKLATVKGETDYYTIFSNAAAALSRSDLTVGNLETPVSAQFPVSGYPEFNAPVDFLYGIKKSGFDLLSLANNHCLDMERQGLFDTLSNLSVYGLESCGAGFNDNSFDRIFFTNINDIKLAFINYSYSFNYKTNDIEYANLFNFNITNQFPSNIIRDIHYSKKAKSDFIILLLHWGFEYRRYPKERIYKYADILTKNGADMIIGTHPHVLQKSAYVTSGKNTSFTAFSLGNFLVYAKKELLKQGVILECTLYKYKNKTYIQKSFITPTYAYSRKGGNDNICRIIDMNNISFNCTNQFIISEISNFMIQRDYILATIKSESVNTELLDEYKKEYKNFLK